MYEVCTSLPHLGRREVIPANRRFRRGVETIKEWCWNAKGIMCRRNDTVTKPAAFGIVADTVWEGSQETVEFSACIKLHVLRDPLPRVLARSCLGTLVARERKDLRRFHLKMLVEVLDGIWTARNNRRCMPKRIW